MNREKLLNAITFVLIFVGIIFIGFTMASDNQGCGKNIPDGDIQYVNLCRP
jgi:hypothetical protein